MNIDTLRAELERLFELDELLRLTSDILELDPTHIGSTTTLASFAHALVDYCAREHTLLALSDVVAVCKPDASPELSTPAMDGASLLPELHPGDLWEGFVIVRKLGSGPWGTSYLATQGGSEVRLKVVPDGAIQGRAALPRFLTYCRLLARQSGPGIPAQLAAHKSPEYLRVQHVYRAGETLAARLARTGPEHFADLRGILEALLGSLSSLHRARLPHGNLQLGNVLVLTSKPTQLELLLLDAGFDRLRSHTALALGSAQGFGAGLAPEQIRGRAADARSDVYAFGVLCYELLAGVSPFAAVAPVDRAIAHLTEEPLPPSRVARHTFIDAELDAFVLGLLAKDPSHRPPHAMAVLEEFSRLQGGRVRLPGDDPQETLRVLLDQVRSAEKGPQRAHLLAQIARAYELGLGNKAQALLSLAEAFCEAPQHAQYADEIERIAGTDEDAFARVLRTCAQAVLPQAVDASAESALLLRMGRWYEHKLSRPELALPCYEGVLAKSPESDAALEGAARIQRKLQNWTKLVELLLARAEHAKTPARARDLRAEAAEVMGTCLHDADRARELYEQIVFEDPTHHAGEALGSIYQTSADHAGYERLLDLRARSARGKERVSLLLRLAEHRAGPLANGAAALATFEAILRENPRDVVALQGLERLLADGGRRGELAQNLEMQLETSATPRQRIELLRRLSQLYSDEYLDRDRAAAALEEIVATDPTDTSAWLSLAEISEQHLGRPEQAIAAYQHVVELVPGHTAALSALARLHDLSGNADAAMQAYELAVEADPRNATLYRALRRLYVENGDARAALQVLECEIELADGDRAKSKLLGQLATLAYDIEDGERATRAAERAHTHDPTNLDARLTLAELAFDAERYAEASSHYEPVIERIQSLEADMATRVVGRYIEALYRTQHTDQALAAQELLTAIAPDDPAAWLWVSDSAFQHAPLAIAAELYAGVLADFSSRLSNAERALCLYRYGETLRQMGQFETAIEALEAAADLEPADPLPLGALAHAHAAREAWEDVMKVKTRLLDFADDSTRLELLLDIGELARDKLDDRALAVKSFALALEEQPEDRRLLTRLMQLYSEDKDWTRLVDVVLRLAKFVEEPGHRTKYLHTAAIVTSRQLGDTERAIDLYEQVLELDPAHDKANRELTLLELGRGNYASVETLIERRLERARENGDVALEVAALDELAELYENHLGAPERAIEVYEAARTLDPHDQRREELLAALYAQTAEEHLDEALSAHMRLLRGDPYRADYYRKLRAIYTAGKMPDAAFCACQALCVLDAASPEEERFFGRFRAETPAFSAVGLGEEEWTHAVVHPHASLPLTRVLAALEPAILALDPRSPAAPGYDSDDGEAKGAPLLRRALDLSAAVLGIEAPPVFRDADPAKGLSFLHGEPPAVVLGAAAINADIPAQAAAFIAARHVSYFQHGMYLRQRVASLLELRRWLYAALKLGETTLPVPPDLVNALDDASLVIARHLSTEQRSQLEEAVAELMESGVDLDLKRWIQGVDLTADRAGLLVADDLETAFEIIRASDEHSSAVPIDERLSELLLYAVSEPYFALRKRLGIAIGT
ncbi:MAG TPA: tetratricopeptide repeat protein [Polyangiaceae bacterium]